MAMRFDRLSDAAGAAEGIASRRESAERRLADAQSDLGQAQSRVAQAEMAVRQAETSDSDFAPALRAQAMAELSRARSDQLMSERAFGQAADALREARLDAEQAGQYLNSYVAKAMGQKALLMAAASARYGANLRQPAESMQANLDKARQALGRLGLAAATVLGAGGAANPEYGPAGGETGPPAPAPSAGSLSASGGYDGGSASPATSRALGATALAATGVSIGPTSAQRRNAGYAEAGAAGESAVAEWAEAQGGHVLIQHNPGDPPQGIDVAYLDDDGDIHVAEVKTLATDNWRQPRTHRLTDGTLQGSQAWVAERLRAQGFDVRPSQVGPGAGQVHAELIQVDPAHGTLAQYPLTGRGERADPSPAAVFSLPDFQTRP
jgi:hypothetical protein